VSTLPINPTLKGDDQESIRKFKKLPTSEWTHYFHSFVVDVSVSPYIYLVFVDV